MIKRIIKKSDLIELAEELEVRPDWHEPDEQEVSVIVRGVTFDNAGFWPLENRDYEEIHVTVYQGHRAVAQVNLATLFAWATGLED